ncbi:hypothetical protein [Nostoc sp. CMAA1605]|uniref:hypothetical protein n=1 Tax=Nostoc sp. CMAA1605 TaxID=2055159 RepID=UPI001F2FBF73|nr:hypothetical protein [Nostoc sp. CMAA1605]MCF4969610.1 hypothetical protein [Nostoc sp. CMAA1605]
MTDEECREVYRQLVAMLNDRDLLNNSQMSWVVEEVDDVIRAGEVIHEPIENFARRSSREFITTREYTPQESLILLIDAIESAVVQTAFIEKEVTNFFRREGEEFNISPEVRFVSEEEDSQPTVFTYSLATDRAEQALILQRLLTQLRSEVRG